MLPLILLHGAIGAKDQLEPLAVELRQLGHEAHTFTFEGHGDQPHRGRPFRVPYLVENIVEYMQTNGIEQANLFGHSLGGLVGLNMAHSHPAKVGRVFTLGTKFVWTPEIALKEHKNLNPEKILEKVPKFAQMLAKRHTAVDWQENMAQSREMMSDFGENPPSFDQLSETQQPVIVSIGDRDNLSTIEESVQAARALPNGALQVFPNTKHPIEQVDMPMLADAIARFML
ncbi:MAG: pimeloyl-ACP methyl ester carboxylesterase [Cellvibrionaceae bacterium]|jgi:pimeloyl-ACP methyl ester carboxylesterase